MLRSSLDARPVIAICALAVTVAPGAAHAQDAFNRYLTAAVRLYEDLEYERALEQLQRAKGLARGVEQDVAVALHEGIILADMGKRAQSQAAFKTGLLLDPDAKLPLVVSPKVVRDFEELRARVYKELGRRPDAPRSKSPEPARPSAPPPQASATDRPEQPTATPDLRAPAPEAPTLYVPGVMERLPSRVPVVSWALAGVGVAALGVGTGFGLHSSSSVNAARSASFQDETRAHWDDARGSARAANVLFGTAGLAVVGALVTWVLSPAEGEPATSKEVR